MSQAERCAALSEAPMACQEEEDCAFNKREGVCLPKAAPPQTRLASLVRMFKDPAPKQADVASAKKALLHSWLGQKCWTATTKAHCGAKFGCSYSVFDNECLPTSLRQNGKGTDVAQDYLAKHQGRRKSEHFTMQSRLDRLSGTIFTTAHLTALLGSMGLGSVVSGLALEDGAQKLIEGVWANIQQATKEMMVMTREQVMEFAVNALGSIAGHLGAALVAAVATAVADAAIDGVVALRHFVGAIPALFSKTVRQQRAAWNDELQRLRIELADANLRYGKRVLDNRRGVSAADREAFKRKFDVTDRADVVALNPAKMTAVDRVIWRNMARGPKTFRERLDAAADTKNYAEAAPESEESLKNKVDFLTERIARFRRDRTSALLKAVVWASVMSVPIVIAAASGVAVAYPMVTAMYVFCSAFFGFKKLMQGRGVAVYTGIPQIVGFLNDMTRYK